MKKKLSKENISKKKVKTKPKKEKREGTQTVHWQKGAMLGKGAFGSVFEAMTDTGEMMAVKQIVLPPSLNMAPSITGAAPVRCPHTPTHTLTLALTLTLSHTQTHTHTHSHTLTHTLALITASRFKPYRAKSKSCRDSLIRISYAIWGRRK